MLGENIDPNIGKPLIVKNLRPPDGDQEEEMEASAEIMQAILSEDQTENWNLSPDMQVDDQEVPREIQNLLH